MKAKCDHRSKFSNLSNWKEEAWKKSGLQRDSNPWPPWYRCDALPTEVWSHTLGARSIYWVHFFPCSEIMWNIYEIIHICTAVWDESDIYFTWFHCTGRNELNKLTLLPMCGFIAQLVEHRTGIAEVMGSNPVEALIFFRLLLSNCLNWKIYCDDHTSLSGLTFAIPHNEGLGTRFEIYIFHILKGQNVSTSSTVNLKSHGFLLNQHLSKHSFVLHSLHPYKADLF